MEYRLGELYEVSNGLSKSGDCFGSGYPFLSFSTVFNNYFIPEEITNLVQSTDKEQAAFSIKAGDVFITRTSETADELGMSCVALKDYTKATYNGFCKRLRPITSNTYPLYMGYLFRTPQFRANFTKIASLITRASLRNEDLLKFKVNLPAVEEQMRIASVLYSYDSLIQNNNKRSKLLEQMAENLYKDWFVRFRFPGYENTEFENGLPKEWEIKKVKDVVKRFPFGKLYKEADVLSEGTVIVIDQSKEPYIGFHNNEPSHTANIDTPIIIFGDHSCKFQLMITPFSLSENVVPFTATNDIDTTYLYYLVKDLIETTEYKRHWTELMSKKILVANNDIQKEFSKTIKHTLLLIESLKVQNRNLTKQRELLLPRLMSGKLEV